MGRQETFGGGPIKVRRASNTGTDCHWIVVAIGEGYSSCAAATVVTVLKHFRGREFNLHNRRCFATC